MTMRLAGLTGMFDTDAMVSATMEPYRLKVTNKIKERDLLQLKQNQYRDVISKCKEFYNKYITTTATDTTLGLSSSYSAIKFTASDGAVSAKALSDASMDNYKVKVEKLAEPAKSTIEKSDLYEGKKIGITIDGKTETFILSGSDERERVKNLNSQLSEKGLAVTAKYSDFSNNGTGGMTLETKKVGSDAHLKVRNYAADGSYDTSNCDFSGNNAKVEITNSAGETITYTGNSNSATFDGVQFTFNSVNTSNNSVSEEGTTLTAKKDVSEIKTKIVNFIKDYNKLIKDLNTKLSEKRYRDYMPLSSDEKKAMQENDIKLWEEKVNQGLIRRDNDVTTLVNSMKASMRTIMEDTGLKLANIGITPVNDYKTENGTFEIDEAKLTEALENNMEGVKELFLKPKSESSVYENQQTGGILTTLKSVFDEQIMSPKANLITKAGTTGSITDDISKELAKMQTKINEMNTALTKREQALYTKYANLESAMNSLSSQQSWLTQQLGS